MNAHAFVNLIHFAYARDPPKDTDTRFHRLGDLPEDLFRRFLESCPPLTLVVLRQVCKAFRQILDDNPIIWANARENISWPSPPLDNDGRPRTEWTWAVRVAKRISSEWMDWTVPRSDRSQIWLSRYRDQWADTQDENMKRVHELVGRRGPNQASGEGAAARIVRTYMRTPACIALLRIFNHSLEIITDAAWNDALPAIHRELGLISSCDPAKIPPDYQCDDYDRILCPACHPRPLGTRWRVTQLATTSKKHKWFEENTILVHKLYEHYETNHPDILHKGGSSVVPAFRCYTRCALCSTRMQNPPLYTPRGLKRHYMRWHSLYTRSGIPAQFCPLFEPEDLWFSNVDYRRSTRYRPRPRF